MNLSDAASLARALMNQHGLGRVPFEFDRSRKRLGCTHWRNCGTESHPTWLVRKITLSEHYARLLGDDEIREVILHEIAHALTPYVKGDAHHGPAFVAKARSLGIAGTRCIRPSDRPSGAWKPVCHVCGEQNVNGYHRAPLRVKACGKCCSKFDPAFIMTWNKNGRPVPVAEMPKRYRDEHARILIKYGMVSTRVTK